MCQRTNNLVEEEEILKTDLEAAEVLNTFSGNIVKTQYSISVFNIWH